ncbi:molybdenum cofactor guanylyltransferase [Bythopirellula polymerisocia]|uniref:Probable molybdenum cofactor guanylyltransferase n=1 Tax=Bythopirellula polymerisocia TaxID=2528003 RepID=A0A5C6CTP6_9BACT|nr:molybdenum cofactor guanylyltransferase [Bythopirellula polymerisocia]TWU27778.1 molybdopterin-guanine dinucleotide biosynthesis protein MobA [Bythopirellula polymerisocia]
MIRGAIILCGGQSSRMGTDKALLPFGEETLLERTVRLVSISVAPQHIVVVAAAEQPLPPLPVEVQIVRDQQPYAGPLAALIEGMQALNSAVPAAFVTGCDAPLLESSVIDLLFDELGDSSAVVPQDAERLYPLTAVYKTNILAEAKLQLAAGRHSLHGLLEQVEIKRIPLETLRKFDPSLASFENLNTLADYEAAISRANTRN